MAWPWRRRVARHAVVPPPRRAAWAKPALPPGPAVCLGFDDGSQIELPATDPRAVALRAVADLLVQDPHKRAEQIHEADRPAPTRSGIRSRRAV